MNTSSSVIKGKIFPRSKLYPNQIFPQTINLCNEKFDWLFIVDPIWLVWNTYISHSLIDSLTDSLTYPRPITYSTRRLRGIFLQKWIDCCLFEKKFKIKKNGVFNLGIIIFHFRDIKYVHFWVIFLEKKYLLVGASSMFWVVDKSVSQWVSESVSEWEMYVFHTNQFGSTINSQSNFSL